MYTLKSTPQDFIVKEISNIDFKEKGRFAICLLKKKNYTTQRAIEQIASSLNIPPKYISFAGTKDKNAVTEQYISIKGARKDQIENIDLNDIDLELKGYSDTYLPLGDLEGNEFIITIRNIDEIQIAQVEKIIKDSQNHPIFIPNFFGEQRFSKFNIEIGKHLIKKQFKEAIDLIYEQNSDYELDIKRFLQNNKNNFTAALKIIPKRLLKLYAHSFQSFLWNKTLELYLKESKENIQIPLIGFGTDINNSLIKKITEKLMLQENITERDFINRQMPELSLEGDIRKAFVEIHELKILEKTKDTVTINFKLRKGSYATVAVKFLLTTKT